MGSGSAYSDAYLRRPCENAEEPVLVTWQKLTGKPCMTTSPSICAADDKCRVSNSWHAHLVGLEEAARAVHAELVQVRSNVRRIRHQYPVHAWQNAVRSHIETGGKAVDRQRQRLAILVIQDLHTIQAVPDER